MKHQDVDIIGPIFVYEPSYLFLNRDLPLELCRITYPASQENVFSRQTALFYCVCN